MYDNHEHELQVLHDAKEYFLININHENDDHRINFYQSHVNKINERINELKKLIKEK